jgi:hypothetical protein
VRDSPAARLPGRLSAFGHPLNERGFFLFAQKRLGQTIDLRLADLLPAQPAAGAATVYS